MSGRPYYFHEKIKILQYIVEEKAYHALRGRKFWQDMEKTITDRTWQSLRDHFRRILLPSLHLRKYGLSDQEVRTIQSACGIKPSVRVKHKGTQVDLPLLMETAAVADSNDGINSVGNDAEVDTENHGNIVDNGEGECSAIKTVSTKSRKRMQLKTDESFSYSVESYSNAGEDAFITLRDSSKVNNVCIQQNVLLTGPLKLSLPSGFKNVKENTRNHDTFENHNNLKEINGESLTEKQIHHRSEKNVHNNKLEWMKLSTSSSKDTERNNMQCNGEHNIIDLSEMELPSSSTDLDNSYAKVIEQVDTPEKIKSLVPDSINIDQNTRHRVELKQNSNLIKENYKETIRDKRSELFNNCSKLSNDSLIIVGECAPDVIVISDDSCDSSKSVTMEPQHDRTIEDGEELDVRRLNQFHEIKKALHKVSPYEKEVGRKHRIDENIYSSNSDTDCEEAEKLLKLRFGVRKNYPDKSKCLEENSRNCDLNYDDTSVYQLYENNITLDSSGSIEEVEVKSERLEDTLDFILHSAEV